MNTIKALMYRKVSLILAVVIVLLAASACGFFSQVKNKGNYPPETSLLLRAGVGAQAPCPTNIDDLALSIERAAEFIHYRSGVKLNQMVKQKLFTLERASLPEWCSEPDCSRLTRQQVKDVITATLMNVLVKLTDSEIDNIAHRSLRVMPDGRCGNVEDYVHVPSSHSGLTADEFVQVAREVRDSHFVFRPHTEAELAGLIDSRLDVMAHACPDWDVAVYSPYQVFMLAYALASDDHLAKSRAEIITEMKRIEAFIYSKCGQVNSFETRYPFGDIGYIYSSPMSVFFSEAVQNDLLNRIDGTR